MNTNNPEKAKVDKIFKEAQKDLKTSFFSLKFSPDFLSAVENFTDAAKKYKKLKLFNESLKAFEEAIKCNKKLLESWAEGQNYLEMAEIYLYELNDDLNGFKCLKNSSFAIKVTGKLSMSIKIYSDQANKLIEKGNNKLALDVLKEAYGDCSEHLHDDLMRISLEEIFSKSLDVYCSLGLFADAADLIINYIKIQKKVKDEKKYKVSKNYLYLGLIRIIMDEAYLVDSIQDEMFSFYDSSCSDDIEDLKNAKKYFDEINKAKMNNLFTYSFTLFPTTLLKALRKAFEKKELAGLTNQVRNINLNNGDNQGDNDTSKTRDNTMSSFLNSFSNQENEENNPADNYL